MIDPRIMQDWPGKNKNRCRYVYFNYLIKALEEQATFFHNAVNAANAVEKFFHLKTLIVGSEKDGYILKVTIYKITNEKYKHQENTHEQKTDL
jgi:hypothetical protein